MLKKIASGILLSLLLVNTLTLAFIIKLVEAEPKTIVVPDDYSTIQEAINAANLGDTVYVRAGTYYENIVVNKTLSLIGEDRETTIIDAGGAATTIEIVCSSVIFKGFCVRNALSGIEIRGTVENIIQNNIVTNNRIGIWILTACRASYGENHIIADNIVANNMYGLRLSGCENNKIFGNKIENNTEIGIDLEIHPTQIPEGRGSHNNSFFYNNILGNQIGVRIIGKNNKLHHNNFINNTKQVQALVIESYNNLWDNGYPSGGNYWSDYTGVDLYSGPYHNETGSDSIGDSPYVIDANNVDRYPLMNPWGTGTPVAIFSWSPSVPKVGELVTFDASASEPIGGEIISYEWDFGDGSCASGKIVTHRYAIIGTFAVTLNVTDSEGLWGIEQKQIEVKAPPPPLTVTISPSSASILMGQSVTFISTVSGGYTPYSYQWFLNGNPVSEATSENWTFAPCTSEIFYVRLKVTDAKGNTAQSDAARIVVSTVPVGGYSIPLQASIKTDTIIPHLLLLTVLTATFITVKRKIKRDQKQAKMN